MRKSLSSLIRARLLWAIYYQVVDRTRSSIVLENGVILRTGEPLFSNCEGAGYERIPNSSGGFREDVLHGRPGVERKSLLLNYLRRNYPNVIYLLYLFIYEFLQASNY